MPSGCCHVRSTTRSSHDGSSNLGSRALPPPEGMACRAENLRDPGPQVQSYRFLQWSSWAVEETGRTTSGPVAETQVRSGLGKRSVPAVRSLTPFVRCCPRHGCQPGTSTLDSAWAALRSPVYRALAGRWRVLAATGRGVLLLRTAHQREAMAGGPAVCGQSWVPSVIWPVRRYLTGRCLLPPSPGRPGRGGEDALLRFGASPGSSG